MYMGFHDFRNERDYLHKEHEPASLRISDVVLQKKLHYKYHLGNDEF